MLELEEVSVGTHEKVVQIADPEIGMNGFIAVHSTLCGPSLGGLRIRNYPTEEHALQDVLKLAEAMTYKAAAAGLPFGGGKAVLIGESEALKSPQLLRQFGAAVEELHGAYVTAEDVGTTVDDLAVVSQSTKWVAGLPKEQGGSGDPSPATARGVLMAMRAVARHLEGSGGLRGLKVLVQGVGKVGSALVDLLLTEGAEVSIADIDRSLIDSALQRGDVLQAVEPDSCLTQEVDILAPCALGGVLNTDSVRQLQCRAVAGSANNQLRSPEVGRSLTEAGILYAPDFIANAGGIINIASEFGYSDEEVEEAIAGIADTTAQVIKASGKENITTHEAAMDVARNRLSASSAP